LGADIRGTEPIAPVEISDSFFSEERAGTPGSPLRALAIGVLVVGSAIALVVFASSSSRNSVAAAAAAAERPVAAPLELLTLRHERDGDRLTVQGVVRSAGVEPANLIAIVSVVDRQGTIVASGQGFVADARRSAAGVESNFTVTIPGVRDVARYRVAFKSNERIIAHVDRRDHGVTAELP
jgi:hypothetical protein